MGNGKGIKLPDSVIESLNLKEHDRLNLQLINNGIVLTKAKKEITIEELFKDYKGGSFQPEFLSNELFQ